MQHRTMGPNRRWWTLPALLVASIAASTRGADADVPEGTTHYVVTSVVDTAQARLVSEELLSLATAGGAVMVRVVDRSGRAMAAMANRDRNGLVAIETNDPAIACYNVAMSILSDAATPHATAPLSVGLAGGTVTMTLQLSSAADASSLRRVTARGSTEATIPDGGAGTRLTFVASGDVTSHQQELVSARIDETSVLTATGGAIAHTSCIVARVAERALSRSAPSAVY